LFAKSPITLTRVGSFWKEKKLILQKEGLSGASEIMVDILKKLKKATFSFECFDIYEYEIESTCNIPIPKCKLSDLEVKHIFAPITLQEYEYLGTQKYDFTRHPEAKEYDDRDKKGTIIFYTFKNGELVNRTGMTLYRNGVYNYICPFVLDDGRTVYAGFSETTKKYRFMGVYSYVHSYIYRYLKEKGFSKVILLESEEQSGPRKVQERLGAISVGRSYVIRILFFINFRWNQAKA
jgi:hypothetical protein